MKNQELTLLNTVLRHTTVQTAHNLPEHPVVEATRMAHQELENRQQSVATEGSATSAAHSVASPDGGLPSVDKSDVRYSILRQAGEGINVRATSETADLGGGSDEHTTPRHDAELTSPHEHEVTYPAEASSSGTTTEQLRTEKNGPSFLTTTGLGNQYLMRLGAALQRSPAVEACLLFAGKALAFCVSLLKPSSEALHRARTGREERTPSPKEDRAPIELNYSVPAQALLHLDKGSLLDTLDGSQKLHAAIIKAAHDLGEAARREDEREQRADVEQRTLEEHEARKAAETVRAIDNLSGKSNGETQSILNKLTGPFALSIDEAIRLARDAEHRELERETVETRIASVSLFSAA